MGWLMMHYNAETRSEGGGGGWGVILTGAGAPCAGG